MKRTTVLFMGILLAASSTYAQDIFKKHGHNKEALTLSKGRYKETFINEDVVQIGTVLINTRTDKVIKFVEEDTTGLAYKAESTSRFLTIDPLAEKFPSISPYVYCKNNPINRVDPDGRDDYFSNTGVFLRRDNKKTDFIWIETKAKDGTVSTTAINKTRLSNEAITSIVGRYNSQLDKTDGAMPAVKIEAVVSSVDGALMQVMPNSTTIQVNKNPGDRKGGIVNKFLNTVSNIKNTLVHERKHVQQHQEKDTRDVSERELDAIETQKAHSTWDGTTDGHTDGHDGYKETIDRYEDYHKKKLGQ